MQVPFANEFVCTGQMPQVESYCDSSMLYRTDQVVHPTQVKNTIVQGVGNMQQNGRHNIGQVSQ